MKKMKKFAAGGRFVDEGESQRYVEDTPDPVAEVPVAAAIPAAVGLRGGRPMAGGLGPIRGDMQPPPQMAVLPPRLPPRFDSGQDGQTAGGLEMGPMLRSQDVSRPMSAGMAGMKKGGAVKKKAKGGTVSSASKRGDGCAIKGKTKGRFV
jgi:hypothetical protein